MTTQLQSRRGTTAEHSTFTGAEGEVTVDTTKDTAVVHDGVTAGGRPLAREDLNNVSTATVSAKLSGGTLSGNLAFGDNNKALFGAGNDLEIYHDATKSIINDAGTGELEFQVAGAAVMNTQAGGVAVTGDLTVDTNTLYVDSTNNRVGVGTATPTYILDIEQGTAQARLHSTAGNAVFRIESTDTGESKIYFADNTSANPGEIGYLHTTDLMYFNVAGAERMRIDASGNLLVGKTTTTGNVAGVDIRPSGLVVATRDQDTCFYANRTTSDGTIIDLRKDNVAVGSIGSYSSDLVIGTADAALRFSDGGNALVPFNVSTGLDTNGSLNLGTSSAQMNYIYTGSAGGIFLNGGTTSANLLDDYEEGSWTPTISNSTTPASGITYSSRQGSYTKVGDMVTVHCYIRATITSAGSGDPQVTGLPFPALTGQTNYYGVSHGINNLLTNTAPDSNFIASSNAQFGANTWRTGINNYITFTAVYKAA